MTSSTAAAIRVEVVDRLDGLRAHARAWDDLAAALPQVMPMLSHAWVATWYAQEPGPDERMLVALAYASGPDGPDVLLGVLPLTLERRRVLGVERERGRVPMAYVTEDGDVLLRPGRERETLPALLGAVRRAVPSLLAIALGGVRDDSPTWEGLGEGLAGWAVQRDVDTHGSSIPVDGSVDAWEAGFTKGLKKDLRAGENRAKRQGQALRFTSFEGPDASPDHLDLLMELEASGWKGREGTAIASTEQSRAKYRLLAERFHAQGRLEWHHLHLGDRLAAARMAVRYDRGLMLLRSAYADELRKSHVGHLSLRAVVRREFERGGGGEVNLVTDWPWCRRWGMRQRPYARVLLVPNRPLPWLLGALPAVARRVGRRMPGLRGIRERWRREKDGRGGT